MVAEQPDFSPVDYKIWSIIQPRIYHIKVYTTVTIQNVLLWLECRHGDACATGQRHHQQAVREAATICPRSPVTLTRPFDLENGVRVTCDVGYLCAILLFLGLSVLDLGPMYATDRQTDVRRQTDVTQTDVRQDHRLMPPPKGHYNNSPFHSSPHID